MDPSICLIKKGEKKKVLVNAEFFFFFENHIVNAE